MENNQLQQLQPDNLIKQSQSPLHRWLPTIIGIAIVVLAGAGFLAWNFFVKTDTDTIKIEEVVQAEFPGVGERIDQDETANWKTYRNEEFGFEVKYPEDWQARQDSTAQFSISEKVPSEITTVFRINISNGTLEQEIAVLGVALDGQYGERILSREDVVVAEKSGIRVVYSTALGLDRTRYFVVSNRPVRPQTYSLSLDPRSSMHPKIFSTFKFIK